MAAPKKSSNKKKTSRFSTNNWLEIGIVGALVMLFLNLLSWPVAIANESLDGSWQAILTFSLENGLRFGEDVVFTYGPLGSYSSFSYSGYNHAGKYGFELLVRLSMVIFLFRFLPNLRLYSKIGCVFVFLLILQFLPDAYETFFFFGMLSWVAALLLERQRKNSGPWALICLGILFIIVVSLVKFTLLVAGVFCVGLLVLYFLLQSRVAEAFVLAVGYPLGFLAYWLVLGQQIGDLPAYFLRSSQVAQGYAMSMHIATESKAFWFFMLFLVSALASVAVVLSDQLRKRKKDPWLTQPWSALLVLHVGFLFMVWKQGVVRSDAHIWQFFCYVPLASWFIFPVLKKSSAQFLYGSLLVVQMLLMVFAMESFYPGFLGEVPGRFWTNTQSGLKGLLKPNEIFDGYREQLHGEKEALVRRYPVLSKVGERTVDVVGNSQAMVINSGLNYQPRPVFQNYVANNAFLQDLNGEYWESDSIPEAVVQSLDAIDGVSPTQADSQTILHLLSRYQREAEDGGLVLLGRRSDPSILQKLKTSDYTFQFGESVNLESSASGFMLAKIDMPLNLLGRLRAFFYKPPLAFMEVEVQDGRRQTFRVNSVTVAREFLLSPLVNTAPELWLYRQSLQALRIIKVTFRTDSGGSLYFKRNPSLSVTSVTWEDSP